MPLVQSSPLVAQEIVSQQRLQFDKNAYYYLSSVRRVKRDSKNKGEDNTRLEFADFQRAIKNIERWK